MEYSELYFSAVTVTRMKDEFVPDDCDGGSFPIDYYPVFSNINYVGHRYTLTVFINPFREDRWWRCLEPAHRHTEFKCKDSNREIASFILEIICLT